MARTLATTVRALALVVWSISASASCLAPTVRFSICDEEADSVRSRIEDIGPRAGLSGPSVALAYESNRASAAAASSASADCCGESAGA